MAEDQGVWVYAIAERLPDTGLSGLAGVGGESVRTVEITGLTAIAGDVDLAEFGEAALRDKLEDLTWLELTARAHHRVIDAAAALGPLLPMRLATVYNSEASMAAVFAGRSEEFRAALDRIRARREWGVKVYAERPPGSGAAAGDSPEAAGPGAAYLRRRRGDLAARHVFRREALASAGTVHSELSGYAAGTRLHPPQSPQLSGNKALMLLNAAYLLDDTREADFAAAVAALARKHRSIRLELTGPWPPYSFATAE
jgi:hypothetical protein